MIAATTLANQAITNHKAVQKEPELVGLLNFLDLETPIHSVLEIGIERGGTLWLWDQIVVSPSVVVGVDIDSSLFQAFVPQSDILFLCVDDSHKDKSLDTVADLGPYDLLYLDGDHSYKGIQQDYSMYAPLVRHGGLIIFHDIVDHDPSVNCHVKEFWDELEGDKQEFVYPYLSDLGWAILPVASCGIGVLRVSR